MGLGRVTIPLFALMALGAWGAAATAGRWSLLLGPLVYFLALHVIFVSSIRYRIPGILPALGLASVGWFLWVRHADRLGRGR